MKPEIQGTRRKIKVDSAQLRNDRSPEHTHPLAQAFPGGLTKDKLVALQQHLVNMPAGERTKINYNLSSSPQTTQSPHHVDMQPDASQGVRESVTDEVQSMSQSMARDFNAVTLLSAADRRQRINKLKEKINDLQKHVVDSAQELAELKEELEAAEEIDKVFEFREDHVETYQQWQSKARGTTAEHSGNSTTEGVSEGNETTDDNDKDEAMNENENDTAERTDEVDHTEVVSVSEQSGNTDEYQAGGGASDKTILEHLAIVARMYPGIALDPKSIWEHYNLDKEPHLDVESDSVCAVIRRAWEVLDRVGLIGSDGDLIK